MEDKLWPDYENADFRKAMAWYENQILLLKDEQIVGIVEPNARVRIERPVMLQVKETKESLQLK